MRHWIAFIALVIALFAAGCGGGGGGSTTGGGTSYLLSGAILDVATGGAPNPAVTIQVGSSTTTSNAVDGSFFISAPAGTTSVAVIFTPTGGSPTTFRFTFPALAADTDLGDLYVGPEKISVSGRIFKAADSQPIPGATITLGGKSATSDANGAFTIADVAYDPGAPGGFLSLQGRASASGFFSATFSPVAGPVGGVATLDDLFLSSDSGNTPPGTPFNIEGFVLPQNFAAQTQVDLYQGATPIRRFVVGSDGKYGFWVQPGTYTLKAQNPVNGKTAPDETVTLPNTTSVVRKDLTLP